MGLVSPEQLGRRPDLAALDVTHIDHRIADRRVGAAEPRIDDHIAGCLCASGKPPCRKGDAARIAPFEPSLLLKCVERPNLSEASEQQNPGLLPDTAFAVLEGFDFGRHR
jgi:hypothetical protein